MTTDRIKLLRKEIKAKQRELDREISKLQQDLLKEFGYEFPPRSKVTFHGFGSKVHVRIPTFEDTFVIESVDHYGFASRDNSTDDTPSVLHKNQGISIGLWTDEDKTRRVKLKSYAHQEDQDYKGTYNVVAPDGPQLWKEFLEAAMKQIKGK